MIRRIAISVFGLTLVASCAIFLGTEKVESQVRPGTVLLSGIDVTAEERQDELARIARELGLIGDNDQERRQLDAGPSSIVVRALQEDSFVQPFDLEAFRGQTGDQRCAKAREEKIAFHLASTGEVPASFGKIVRMDLKNYQDDYWAGEIDLCTWIREGNSYDEYFIQMKFLPDLPGTVQTRENQGGTDPFPDTLDLSQLADPSMILATMQKFKFKLHGSDDAVDVVAAFRNGQLLPATDEIYIEGDNCFDFFLEDEMTLQTIQGGTLPPQASYCMGRCNALILNTY